jgi:hypothetical protein
MMQRQKKGAEACGGYGRLSCQTIFFALNRKTIEAVPKLQLWNSNLKIRYKIIYGEKPFDNYLG